jgi:hypothetical protein
VGVIEIREYAPGTVPKTMHSDNNEEMFSTSWRYDNGTGTFTDDHLDPNGEISCDYYISNIALFVEKDKCEKIYWGLLCHGLAGKVGRGSLKMAYERQKEFSV